MVATLVPFDESLSSWERALYAFLAEKQRRSGSDRAVPILSPIYGSTSTPGFITQLGSKARFAARKAMAKGSGRSWSYQGLC